MFVKDSSSVNKEHREVDSYELELENSKENQDKKANRLLYSLHCSNKAFEAGNSILYNELFSSQFWRLESVCGPAIH